MTCCTLHDSLADTLCNHSKFKAQVEVSSSMPIQCLDRGYTCRHCSVLGNGDQAQKISPCSLVDQVLAACTVKWNSPNVFITCGAAGELICLPVCGMQISVYNCTQYSYSDRYVD